MRKLLLAAAALASCASVAGPALSSASLRSWTIDKITRPRLFAIVALEPAAGGETLSGFPLWPDVTPTPSE
jgi:hypothetical protein